LFREHLITPFKATFSLLFLIFAVQGSLTWIYGYHSFQQMLLGGSIGILFAGISYRVALLVCKPLQRKNVNI
jgi:hypothetical protein